MEYLIVILTSIYLYLPTLFNSPVVDEKWGRDRIMSGKKIPFKNRFYGAGTFLNIYLDRAFTIILYTLLCTLVVRMAGLWAGLLFCANPINNQISMWMNGRRYCINIIIALSVLCYPIFLFPLFFITPALQINVIALPFILPLFTGEISIPIIMIIICALIYKIVIRRIKSRWNIVPEGEKKEISMNKLIVIVKTLGFYLINSLCPTPKNMFYSYLQSFGVDHNGNKKAYSIDKDFWVSVTALSLFICTGIFSKNIIVSVCVLSWFFAMAPSCNIVTYTQTIADRYASFANVFLMIAVANILPIYATVALFTAYILRTIDQIKMYKSQEHLSQWHLHHQPDCIENVYFRCLSLIKYGDYHAALVYAKYALQFNPSDFRLNYIMASTLAILSPSQAKPFLETAKRNVYLGSEEKLLNSIEELEKKLKKSRENY